MKNIFSTTIVCLLCFFCGLSSAFAQKNHFAFENVRVNVYCARGVVNNNRYLSTTTDGRLVDLYSKDDGSGRQQWVFTKIGTHPDTYHIKVYDGVGSTNQFLSSTSTGDKVDLYSRDDNSGRQRWTLVPLGNNMYNIKIAGGVSDRMYLSTSGDGKVVDLWNQDDGMGRQRWTIFQAR